MKREREGRRKKEREKKKTRAHLITPTPYHMQRKDTLTHTLVTHTTFSVFARHFPSKSICWGKPADMVWEGRAQHFKKVMATFQILVTSALRICPNVHRQRQTQKDSPYEMGADTRTSCLGDNAPISTALK